LPQLPLIDRYCVQDQRYASRLRELGVPESSIHVTGNLKYDGVLLKDPPPESATLARWLSPDGRLVVVGGSTHGDEEQTLALATRAVAGRLGKSLRLVLAPRHPERAAGVLERLGALRLACVSWTKLAGQPLGHLPDDAIVIVDTIGHLEAFYGACDIAFVGGSLVPRGGQNMLEPAALGKPVMFGPHTHNFTTDVRLLAEARAAIEVRDGPDFERQLEVLCRDSALRGEVGRRAVEVIRRNQGATRRTLELLHPLLDRLTNPPGRAGLPDGRVMA
jgi:3-deoxy-D-manno-octulosonic-acid transferase